MSCTSQLIGKWSIAYLAEHYGPSEELGVHVVSRDTRGFARHYGKGLGKGGVVPMSFGQFYEKIKREHLQGHHERAHWKFYLQSPVVWYDEEVCQHLRLHRPAALLPLTRLSIAAGGGRRDSDPRADALCSIRERGGQRRLVDRLEVARAGV